MSIYLRHTLSVLLGLLVALSAWGDIRSIQRLTVAHPAWGEGACTTFSINRKKGYWLTAGHCTREYEDVLPTFEIAGQAATLVKVDTGLDLALLTGPQAGALWLRALPPQKGDTLIVSGHVGGNPLPLTLEGTVVEPYHENPTGDLWVRSLTFTGAINQTLFGLSGSPIFLSGQVVSLDQGFWLPGPDNDDGFLHLGSTWQDLVAFTKGYWEDGRRARP